MVSKTDLSAFIWIQTHHGLDTTYTREHNKSADFQQVARGIKKINLEFNLLHKLYNNNHDINFMKTLI